MILHEAHTMLHIAKTYNMVGEKAQDNDSYMTAYINICFHFCHNSEFDHSALFIGQFTKAFY